jgi:hypothetical protein
MRRFKMIKIPEVTELKPCPICGNSNQLKILSFIDEGVFHIYCWECSFGISGKSVFTEKIVTLWNDMSRKEGEFIHE